MEMQLQELIDKIKKDGVEEAESKAQEILSLAQREADKLVSDAKAKADKIIADAKTENDRIVKSAQEAIRQAGRNVLISFRESVARELNALTQKQVEGVYSSEKLSQLIVKVIEGWKDSGDFADISVILNSEDLKALENGLLSQLNDRLKEGVILKANDSFRGGFRIATEGGRAYYDYSADAVVEMMSSYLSPRVTALLKEAQSNG